MFRIIIPNLVFLLFLLYAPDQSCGDQKDDQDANYYDGRHGTLFLVFAVVFGSTIAFAVYVEDFTAYEAFALLRKWQLCFYV